MIVCTCRRRRRISACRHIAVADSNRRRHPNRHPNRQDKRPQSVEERQGQAVALTWISWRTISHLTALKIWKCHFWNKTQPISSTYFSRFLNFCA
jgi:hypothetical protein